MARVQNALVVGAGIGGLGVGAALAQRGIQTEVLEIKPEPNVYGVGINQPGNSLRALRALGVLDEIRAVGFEFDYWDFNDAAGQLVVHCPCSLASDGVPHNVALSRPELHRILIAANERAGVQISYGTTVAELADDNGAAQVKLTDGREAEYDLVVACDGVNSPTRNRLFGDQFQPAYTGFGVWRVTVPRPPDVHGGALFQAVDRKAGYIPLSQETMYLLLVIAEPHHARYDKAALPAMLRERLEPFTGIVGQIRDAITDDDDVVYGPLSEIRLPAPWFGGRVAICGDAAHACTPHLTQGAGMALEDAIVLADELATGDRPLDDALQAYSDRRFPRAKVIQDASRGILQAEMSITAENIGHAFEHMKSALPEQFAHLDEFLCQPA
jgi:2-polyprenyl-6-methoxyphenol hydroxylase-like FAD-dependent oxidoreductase